MHKSSPTGCGITKRAESNSLSSGVRQQEILSRTHAQSLVQLPEVHPQTVRQTNALLELEIRMLKSQVCETVLYS